MNNNNSSQSEGQRPERSEVNEFVMPRELRRVHLSEKCIYIHINIYIYIYIYTVENVNAVAWQQCNKASMASDKRMTGTPVVEHGKQRWRMANGTQTIERTFYQLFWFQRR